MRLFPSLRLGLLIHKARKSKKVALKVAPCALKVWRTETSPAQVPDHNATGASAVSWEGIGKLIG